MRNILKTAVTLTLTGILTLISGEKTYEREAAEAEEENNYRSYLIGEVSKQNKKVLSAVRNVESNLLYANKKADSLGFHYFKTKEQEPGLDRLAINGRLGLLGTAVIDFNSLSSESKLMLEQKIDFCKTRLEKIEKGDLRAATTKTLELMEEYLDIVDEDIPMMKYVSEGLIERIDNQRKYVDKAVNVAREHRKSFRELVAVMDDLFYGAQGAHDATNDLERFLDEVDLDATSIKVCGDLKAVKGNIASKHHGLDKYMDEKEKQFRFKPNHIDSLYQTLETLRDKSKFYVRYAIFTAVLLSDYNIDQIHEERDNCDTLFAHLKQDYKKLGEISDELTRYKRAVDYITGNFKLFTQR